MVGGVKLIWLGPILMKATQTNIFIRSFLHPIFKAKITDVKALEENMEKYHSVLWKAQYLEKIFDIYLKFIFYELKSL